MSENPLFTDTIFSPVQTESTNGTGQNGHSRHEMQVDPVVAERNAIAEQARQLEQKLAEMQEQQQLLALIETIQTRALEMAADPERIPDAQEYIWNCIEDIRRTYGLDVNLLTYGPSLQVAEMREGSDIQYATVLSEPVDGQTNIQHNNNQQEPVVVYDMNTDITFQRSDPDSRTPVQFYLAERENQTGTPDERLQQLSQAIGLGVNTMLRIEKTTHDNISTTELLKAMREQAIRDPLTNLLNRRGYYERVNELVRTARRNNSPLSFLMLDADHFKRVNDTYGHDAGDEVLRTIAQRAQEVIRGEDIVARWGGEEFIVTAQASTDDAASLAERLHKAISINPIVLKNGTIITITMSIGYATTNSFPDPHDQDALLQAIELTQAQADIAVYHAKETGRNRCVPFTDVPDTCNTAAA